MTASDNPFLMGVTYWPRHKAFWWWANFDRSEVRDELAQIAEWGCNSVRICLHWENVQASRERLNSDVLRALEHSLDIAADVGLRVVVSLFPVTLGGALHVPRWVNHPDPIGELQQAARFGPPLEVSSAGRPPVIYEHGYRRNEVPDVFRDTAIREAQLHQINEVVGYFGAHPAAWAWQLGEGLERLRRPDSSEAVHEWYAALAEAVRAQRNGARVLGVTSVRGLRTPTGPRPEHLADACDMVGVSVSPPLHLGRGPLRATAIEFLYALASGLAEQPVAVTGLGLPTVTPEAAGWVADRAYGRELATFLADEEQQAMFIGEALERLYRAGAPGVWLSAYADYPAELWRRPPLDRSIRERTLGLVAADGREKAAARAISSFAVSIAQADQAASRQPPTLDLDPERYWREPRREYEQLWHEWSEEEA